MKLAVPAERREGETRVAVTPDTVRRLKGLGLDVVVESGAGLKSAMTDAMYQAAGATIAPDAASALGDADIVFKVQRPMTAAEGSDEPALMKPGALLVAMMAPYQDRAALAACAQRGVNAAAMELMPRITRAQTMDVLSSQANLAGYKAVLEASVVFGRAFPMMMTAAGTVAPAKVMVMGAGVAGLQAIATARRLGAVVSATDVRLAAKEQVQSLGAAFVMVEDDETKQAETSGGYAKEMSDAYKQKQAALIAETLKKQDIAITTALIPGRPAPKLITAAMVESMKPGSVIVDMAADAGGNCELTEPGKTVVKHGVSIIGMTNAPARIPVDASALYARNLFNFLAAFFDAKEGKLNLNPEDEIVKAVLLTRDGQIVHPAFAGA
jgi:NAD(P) transhydrogenase subunit alpha